MVTTGLFDKTTSDALGGQGLPCQAIHGTSLRQPRVVINLVSELPLAAVAVAHSIQEAGRHVSSCSVALDVGLAPYQQQTVLGLRMSHCPGWGIPANQEACPACIELNVSVTSLSGLLFGKAGDRSGQNDFQGPDSVPDIPSAST